MRRVLKFLRWNARERHLMLAAWATLWKARVLLNFSPLERVHALRPVASNNIVSNLTPDEVAWAIQRASLFVPRSTCLVRALAGHALLRRAGVVTMLHIGVAKGALGEFKAHAWLEVSGEILIGAAEAGNYVPMAAFASDGRVLTTDSTKAATSPS